MERQAGVEGLGEIGEDVTKRRGGLQSGGNVLQGGGTGGALIRLRVLGPVGGNRENDGRDTHRVSVKNHGEAGAVEGGQDVVYTIGRGSAGSGNNLHQAKTGDGGTVGGTAADIRGLRNGDGL